MLKQRIAMRRMSPDDCKGAHTGFLAIERGADVEFACGGCGKTLLLARQAHVQNVLAFCNSCNTSNALQA
jgi:hypothetical protein